MIKLSVVIATYNRAEGLARTLGSLSEQTLDRDLWEVVVVNNNSSDDTEPRFLAWQSASPGIVSRIVFEPNQGLSHARNRGIAEARGEYIVIIDDDELASAKFCQTYYDFFRAHPSISAAGGRMIPFYEYPVPQWLTPYTEHPLASTLDLGDTQRVFPRRKYPIGGNMAFRSRVFKQYGAFNPDLGRKGSKLLAGEEKDLFHRLRKAGETICYVPDAIIFHIIPESRFSKDYFDRVTHMSGVSERIRTLRRSIFAYFGRLLEEIFKWCATVILGVWYMLRGTASKGKYLVRMRWNITRGLLFG